MSLPLPLAAAANLFIEKFFVFNVISSETPTDSGRQEGAKEPDRLISGVIQTDKNKEVSVASDGSISDGNLMLHTQDILSAADLSQDGQTNTQSYVRYKGEIWKVNELSNWAVKADNYKLYLLTKYTNVDVTW